MGVDGDPIGAGQDNKKAHNEYSNLAQDAAAEGQEVQKSSVELAAEISQRVNALLDRAKAVPAEHRLTKDRQGIEFLNGNTYGSTGRGADAIRVIGETDWHEPDPQRRTQDVVTVTRWREKTEYGEEPGARTGGYELQRWQIHESRFGNVVFIDPKRGHNGEPALRPGVGNAGTLSQASAEATTDLDLVETAISEAEARHEAAQAGDKE